MIRQIWASNMNGKQKGFIGLSVDLWDTSVCDIDFDCDMEFKCEAASNESIASFSFLLKADMNHKKLRESQLTASSSMANE